jgi:hypothetical protein
MRSPRTSGYSLASAMWTCVCSMAKLILLGSKRLTLREEARELARLGKHIEGLKNLYEDGALKLARKILGETNLSQDIKFG